MQFTTLEQEQLGEHLTDDARDGIAIGLKIFEGGKLQESLLVAAPHETGHAVDGPQRVVPDARARRVAQIGHRFDHRAGLAEQLSTTLVSQGRIGPPRGSHPADLGWLGVAEQAGHTIQLFQFPRRGPVRGIFQRVRDAEQQVGHGHLAPQRIGEPGNGQGKGPTGLQQKIVEDSLLARATGLDHGGQFSSRGPGLSGRPDSVQGTPRKSPSPYATSSPVAAGGPGVLISAQSRSIRPSSPVLRIR